MLLILLLLQTRTRKAQQEDHPEWPVAASLLLLRSNLLLARKEVSISRLFLLEPWGDLSCSCSLILRR